MKTQQNTIDELTKQFDKELRALLMHDLKQFKAQQGQFLRKSKANNENNDRLVA